MSNILLVDLNGNFFPVWHASGDREVGFARQHTIARVRKVAADYDIVCICCESRTPTWRKEAFPDYKAQREPPSEQLKEELRRTEEALAAEGYSIVRSDGYEADDVIATLAEHCDDREHKVDILSDDKDFAQLVSKHVLLNTTRGMVDAEAVVDRWGVFPGTMRDLQALCGDTADNVPGVKGIGPKTAAKLLADHSTLEGIVLAAADGRIKGKTAERILDADKSGALAIGRRLVTLSTDALTPEEIAAALVNTAPQTETAEDFKEAFVDIEEQLREAEAPEPEPSAPVVEAEPVSGPGIQRAMVPYQNGDWARGLEPRDMAEAKQLAKYVLDSRLFSAFGTPQAALLVIMSGRELGIGAMSALRSFHIVEGKPTMSAQLIKGLCQSSAQCEYFMLVEASTEAATFETRRRGEPQPTRWTYTLKDAEAAGLLGKKNWRAYPKAMLCNRCIAELGRFVYPDVVANLYTPDELGADVPEEVAA